MNRAFAAVVVLAGLASSARAGCPTCCCPPCVTWVPCSITCYHPEVRTRDVPFTVTKLVPREEIIQRPCVVMVPQWHDEKRTCSVTVMQPRTLTQQHSVESTCMMTVKDPCTGCCYTVCKPVFTLVSCTKTFMAPVAVPMEYTVKVCQMVPVARTVQERRTVCDTVAVPMVRKECFTVMVPRTVAAQMPVVSY